MGPQNAIFWSNWLLVPGITKKISENCVLIGSYFGCKLTPVELLCDILYSRNTSEGCTGLGLVPRAVATVGRVVITFFRQCDCYTTHIYVFWDSDSESDTENFEFEITDRTDDLNFLKLQWGTKKKDN